MRFYEFWQELLKTPSCSAVWLLGSIAFAFSASGWLLLFVLVIRQRKRRKKEGCALVSRRMQYTLPQRENGYIRTRLQNGLKVENMDEGARQVRVRLGYARILLGKVNTAPLTVAERLQTEKIAKTLALYRDKNEWTAWEVRGVNDTCATLLKLAAKYAV
jgi:hypothetical protein